MSGAKGEEAHQEYKGRDGSHEMHSKYFFMFDSYDLLHASAV